MTIDRNPREDATNWKNGLTSLCVIDEHVEPKVLVKSIRYLTERICDFFASRNAFGIINGNCNILVKDKKVVFGYIDGPDYSISRKSFEICFFQALKAPDYSSSCTNQNGTWSFRVKYSVMEILFTDKYNKDDISKFDISNETVIKIQKYLIERMDVKYV